MDSAEWTPQTKALVVGSTAGSVTSLGAILFARRWGLTGWVTDVTISSSVVIVPFLTVWVAMIVAVVLIGISDHPAFVPYALMFGIPITMIISAIVAGVDFLALLAATRSWQGSKERV